MIRPSTAAHYNALLKSQYEASPDELDRREQQNQRYKIIRKIADCLEYAEALQKALQELRELAPDEFGGYHNTKDETYLAGIVSELNRWSGEVE